MALIFLLALILTPLIEITLFVEIGGEIGALPVVLLTVATAAAGIGLVRAQGLHTLRSAQRELDAGRAPVAEMMHGAMLVAAGLFLLAPGFMTDALGALLLLPPVRRLVVRQVLARHPTSARDVTIEGRWRSVDDDSDGLSS